MNAKDWLDRVTGEASVNATAQKAGVPQKTLDTQLRSHTGLKPDMIVKIARAYHVSPVTALVELGLLTNDEARDVAGITDGLEQIGIQSALRSAKDGQILKEIGTRLKERKFTLADANEEGLS